MPHAYIRTVCLENYTEQQIADLKDEMDRVFKFYFGWLSLPTAIMALVLVLLYSIAVCNAIRRRRVNRKCYVLLLNRSLGDVVCCIAAVIAAIYVFSTKHPSRDLVTIFEVFFMASFWSAMVSYVSLSAMKLYAVWQPLRYRKIVTMRRCVYTALLSWFVFGIILFVTLLMIAMVKVPLLNSWSGCRLETCLRKVYVVRHSTVIIIYFFTIFAYVFTVILIKRAENFAKKYSKSSCDKEEQRSRFPLWKLSSNVATFAGITVFYVIWCIYLLFRTDPCFFQQHYVEMTKWLGVVRCTLMFRIQIDPIISFITDYQIRYGLISCFDSRHRTANSSLRSYSRNSRRYSESGCDSSIVQQKSSRRKNRPDCNTAAREISRQVTEFT